MLLFYYFIILVSILSNSKLAFAVPLPSQPPPDTPSAYLDLGRYDETGGYYGASQRETSTSNPSASFRSSSERYRTPSPQRRYSGSGSGSGIGRGRGSGRGSGRRSGSGRGSGRGSERGSGSGSGSESGENSSQGRGRGGGRRGGSGRTLRTFGQPILISATSGKNNRGHTVHYQKMSKEDKDLIHSNTSHQSDIYDSIGRSKFITWLARLSNDDYQAKLSSTNTGVVRAAMQEIMDKQPDGRRSDSRYDNP